MRDPGKDARVSPALNRALHRRGGGLRSFSGAHDGVGPVKSVPDAELIACQVNLGMPLVAARAIEHSDQARLHALRLWADVQDYDVSPECKERVDYVREALQTMRQTEMMDAVGKNRPV